MNLKEKYVLLSLNDTTGGIERGLYHYGTALSACILLDMVIMEILQIKGGKLTVAKSTHPRDKIYWDVIQRMNKSKKDKTLKFWVSSFNMQSGKYRKIIIKDLVAHGILKTLHRRFLGIPYKRYPSLNPKPEAEFRADLLKSLNTLNEIDQTNLALLCILEASKSLGVLIKDRDTQKQVSKDLKKAVKENAFGKAVNDAVQEMTAVIMTTVITSSAVN